MAGGRTFLLIGGCLIGASCASDHVQIRALAEPGATTKTGNALLDQARGQLAMGSVGLALESFRTLQQQQGDNVETFEGIAQCYAAMGRYDLTQTNLEFALAYSPNEPRLLDEMSAAMEKLGNHAQALEAREEANRLRTATAVAAISTENKLTPVGVAKTGSVTVKLPPPTQRVITAKSGTRQLVVPQIPAATKQAQEPTNPPAKAGFKSTEPVSSPNRVGPTPAPQKASAIPARTLEFSQTPSASIAMLKPRMKKATELPAASANGTSPRDPSQRPDLASLAAPLAEERQPSHSTRPDVRLEQVPHLERTSRGEVALVTGVPQAKWSRIDIAETRAHPRTSSPTAQQGDPLHPPAAKALAMTSLKWVPLKGSDIGNVQLLNAAHRQGLAANMRTTLLTRGWRKIKIGTASVVRARTVVLYGKDRTRLAYRLAAQFKCKTKKITGLRNVIVLLGRDAIRVQSPSARA